MFELFKLGFVLFFIVIGAIANLFIQLSIFLYSFVEGLFTGIGFVFNMFTVKKDSHQ